jgi:hypothetical protein
VPQSLAMIWEPLVNDWESQSMSRVPQSMSNIDWGTPVNDLVAFGVSSRLRHMKIVRGNYLCVVCLGGGSRLVQCDGHIIRDTFAAVCLPRR